MMITMAVQMIKIKSKEKRFFCINSSMPLMLVLSYQGRTQLLKEVKVKNLSNVDKQEHIRIQNAASCLKIPFHI